jgi:type I restriction enzyme S subunit
LVRFLVAGAQPNISSKDIESVRIPFPLTIEQQKISQFLSSIDTQLKLIETQIDKSKTWKKGLLQKMFV